LEGKNKALLEEKKRMMKVLQIIYNQTNEHRGSLGNIKDKIERKKSELLEKL